MKVLVVESNGDACSLWRRVLEAGDFEVSEAYTVQGALSEVTKEQPNILVLAWTLDGDADLILDHWIGRPASGPVMVLGDHDVDSMPLYVRGAWHVLRKPVDPGVLLAIVRRYSFYLEYEARLREMTATVQKLKYWILVLAVLSATNLANLPALVKILGNLF